MENIFEDKSDISLYYSQRLMKDLTSGSHDNFKKKFHNDKLDSMVYCSNRAVNKWLNNNEKDKLTDVDIKKKSDKENEEDTKYINKKIKKIERKRKMSIYESIVDELQNRVNSGEITLEFAESVNELAYDKYVMESFKDGMKKVGKAASKITPEGYVAIGLIATTTFAVFSKIKGDKNYKNNIKKFPELKEAVDEMEEINKKIDKEKKDIDGYLSKYEVLTDKYNEIANTSGAPKISVPEYSWVPVQKYDEIRGWWTDYEYKIKSVREEQNRNFNPIMAKKAKNYLDELESVSEALDECANFLDECKLDMKKAEAKFKAALRKYKNVVEKEKGKAKVDEAKSKAKEVNSNLETGKESLDTIKKSADIVAKKDRVF